MKDVGFLKSFVNQSSYFQAVMGLWSEVRHAEGLGSNSRSLIAPEQVWSSHLDVMSCCNVIMDTTTFSLDYCLPQMVSDDLCQWFSTRGGFAPQETFGNVKYMAAPTRGLVLVLSPMSGILLNTLQGTREPCTTKNYLAQHVTSSRLRNADLCKCIL